MEKRFKVMPRMLKTDWIKFVVDADGRLFSVDTRGLALAEVDATVVWLPSEREKRLEAALRETLDAIERGGSVPFWEHKWPEWQALLAQPEQPGEGGVDHG